MLLKLEVEAFISKIRNALKDLVLSKETPNPFIKEKGLYPCLEYNDIFLIVFYADLVLFHTFVYTVLRVIFLKCKSRGVTVLPDIHIQIPICDNIQLSQPAVQGQGWTWLYRAVSGTALGSVGPGAYAIYGEQGSLLIKKYEILNSKSATGP